MSLDGLVGGPDGQLDWMTWTWDMPLQEFVTNLTDTIDTILLGRKMTDAFIAHWEAAASNSEDPSKPFADKMVSAQKVVFSRTQKEISGKNARITNNDVVEEVTKLKTESGKDIIVYGGADFVHSLIQLNLIDEYYLFVNPTAVGNGLRIFSSQTPMKLEECIAFECGIVLHKYVRP